jgi:hypothetical protein
MYGRFLGRSERLSPTSSNTVCMIKSRLLPINQGRSRRSHVFPSPFQLGLSQHRAAWGIEQIWISGMQQFIRYPNKRFETLFRQV